MKSQLKKYLILIIPALYLVWSLLLNIHGGPFSLSRSDPEYPYLLNGLNCATLDFNNIGHTDHPGTPFQMLTGIFIRLTHLAAGNGPIVEDVLLRPEFYLSAASTMLAILTFLLIYLLGRVAISGNGALAGALILQSTLLLHNVLIDLPLRYNPDRILVLYNLILAGLTVRFFRSPNYAAGRYALHTGILMGIGFATKFNYLPVLVLPFLILPGFKNKLIYGASAAGAFFLSILPIINRFGEFRKFITGVASHDGLYGGGSEQMINWKAFLHNFVELLRYSPAFTVILVLAVLALLVHYFKKRELLPDRRHRALLIAFLLASAVGFVLVSKHFKVYYFAPVLSLAGLVLFLLTERSVIRIVNQRFGRLLPMALLAVLILGSAIRLPAQYRSRLSQKEANLATAGFFDTQVRGKGILFIEPTWMAGPMVENALVYGISYVRHRHEFNRVYARLYPDVFTWEGSDRNPGVFRTAEADPEAFLFCGRDIYVYSSPGRYAQALISYLDTLASRYGTSLKSDTVFFNPANDDRIIRIRNAELWGTLSDETHLKENLTLSPAFPVTEPFSMDGVAAGDYIEMTVRINRNDPENGCRLIARSEKSDTDGIYFEDSRSLQDTGHGTQLLRLRGRVPATPFEGSLTCQVYYPGKEKVEIRELSIRHFGRRQ